ncbi:MAG: hypothetical protein ABJP45_08685 [Cyclobacteriaceae bacterium]
MSKKIFSEKQVDISAFLAGPIPPGILIYQNYKALGKDRQANISLATTLIFTIIFFYAMLQIPEEILDKIPNFAFSAFYGLIVFLFFRRFMAKDVTAALESGTQKRSNWSVAGITILGLVLNLGIILGLSIDQPFYEGEVVTVKGNELYYSPNVSKGDVNKLLKQFESQDFFGQDYGNIARLELIGDEYYITMVVEEQLWADEGIISYVTSLKWLMEVEFGKPTNLKLESISLAGNTKTKYITR